jgi:hypothetical protein
MCSRRLGARGREALDAEDKADDGHAGAENDRSRQMAKSDVVSLT